METLGRYPLTVILSFLNEAEGTSLLITKKRYAFHLLPLFRLRGDAFDGLKVNKSKHRHRFTVCPAQDPVVLLDRLNTRKLFQRRTSTSSLKMTTSELATKEWNQQCRQFPAQLQCLCFLKKSNQQFSSMLGTLVVSYPRSGNTLLRTLLEKVTGVVTGSDTRPDRFLSLELAECHNLVGEGVTHSSLVAFVKTHWPERTGNQVFKGKRAILLVRNPYDAIDSYWNLNVTKSHTKTVADTVYERFQDKFERLTKNEIRIWLQFQDFWLRQQTSIPVLLVRFEDLVRNPAQELARVILFASQTKELLPFWKDRIDYVVDGSESIERMGSYKPRSNVGTGFGKSIFKKRYTKDTIEYMHRAASQIPCTDYLNCLGYSIYEHDFPSEKSLQRFQHDSLGAIISKKNDDSIMVNQGVPIRPVNCEFGRLMTQWRHSITDNDAHPLPTMH